MSRVLLDTTFLVDAERGGDHLDSLVDDDDDVAVAAITIAELRVGVELSAGRVREDRSNFVDEVVGSLEVVEYGLEVAASHAELLVAVRRQGRPRGAHDLIIAATAKAKNRTVVTADHRAFDGLPGVAVRSHR